MDTPGIHKRQSKLGDYMNQTAMSTLGEVEAVLFLVDASEGLGGGDRYIAEQLNGLKTPVILVLNKIDKIEPEALLPLMAQYNKLHDFAEIIPISAKMGSNVNTLLEQVAKYLPEMLSVLSGRSNHGSPRAICLRGINPGENSAFDS